MFIPELGKVCSVETNFGASLFVTHSGADYWVCVNEPLINTTLGIFVPAAGCAMCEGFYLGSQSTASSRKSCKVVIPRGGRRSLALGSHLKYSQKFVSPFWLRIFYCPWGFKLIQGRKREFAFELRVQSAQCELLGDLSSCPAIEFLVISGNSTAKRAQGFYLPVPWDLSGLEHNKAELLSKRRWFPQLVQAEMLSWV